VSFVADNLRDAAHARVQAEDQEPASTYKMHLSSSPVYLAFLSQSS
jgi:hypothetical protein